MRLVALWPRDVERCKGNGPQRCLLLPSSTGSVNGERKEDDAIDDFFAGLAAVRTFNIGADRSGRHRLRCSRTSPAYRALRS